MKRVVIVAAWLVACNGRDGRRGTDDQVSEPSEGTDPSERGTPVEPDVPEPRGDGVACYLGADRSGTTCVDVVLVSSLPRAYDYPAPLSGSAQYLEPARYLDLNDLDPSLRLAPNFRLDEVAQSFKGRFGVVQTHAIGHLQRMRDAVGAIVINSGYRSPDYNDGVGGATWSRHMYGDAFDMDPVSASLNELADECEGNGAGFVSVYETHVHCDWRDDRLDPAFYPVARSAAVGWTEQPLLDANVERVGDMLIAPASGWDEGEPLREWTAYDRFGEVVASDVGRAFAIPESAATVEVVVGRALMVRYSE